MNSAQFHLDLLEAGGHLFDALAQERNLRVRNSQACGRRWRHRLQAARLAVERCAERYAGALKRYRLSMLSEFAPSESVASAIPARVSKHRERTRILGASVSSYRRPAARK